MVIRNSIIWNLIDLGFLMEMFLRIILYNFGPDHYGESSLCCFFFFLNTFVLNSNIHIEKRTNHAVTKWLHLIHHLSNERLEHCGIPEDLFIPSSSNSPSFFMGRLLIFQLMTQNKCHPLIFVIYYFYLLAFLNGVAMTVFFKLKMNELTLWFIRLYVVKMF